MENPYETVFSTDRTFKVMIPVNNEAGSIYVNLLDFFKCVPSELKECAGYVNDFLILKTGSDVNYRDVNLFVKKILEKI